MRNRPPAVTPRTARHEAVRHAGAFERQNSDPRCGTATGTRSSAALAAKMLPDTAARSLRLL